MGTPTSLVVRWRTAANVVRNRIYRYSGGAWSVLATIDAGTSYSDTTAVRRVLYYCIVTALNNSGAESQYSNMASAKAK